MRILIVEEGWLEIAGELKKLGIILELKPRAVAEKSIDGMLLPVTAWPVVPNRKHHVEVVLYGRSDEISDELRNESAASVLETDELLTPELAAAAVKAAFAARTRLPFVKRQSTGTMRMPTLPPARSTIRTKEEQLYEEAGLSERQRETMRLAVNGLGREESARKMGIAEPTVRTQRTLSFAKLGVRNARELQTKLLK